jgi:NAD(P)-dependent dehydrogenase (short-subunit alcohol dehydrogenase family)
MLIPQLVACRLPHPRRSYPCDTATAEAYRASVLRGRLTGAEISSSFGAIDVIGCRALDPEVQAAVVIVGTGPLLVPLRWQGFCSVRRWPHMNEYAKPPFPRQTQAMPGTTEAMRPRPDHGEESYKGSGKLTGKKAVITGADSGIGRAVAVAYARDGADILIAYLNEHEDAKETERVVREAGRKAILVAGDVASSAHCRAIIAKAVHDLGGIDILVNNAAHQATFATLEDITDEEWEITFKVNVHAMFYLTKAAVPHMKPGSAIINTASINADAPNPTLLPYATTKGAIQNFTAGLAQFLANKGIRANAVAPGPIWTPLIPSTMSEDTVEKFGANVPMNRPGQPAELATAYVMLADPLSSYTSGATIAVTGGRPLL